jgi:hypothetical protein
MTTKNALNEYWLMRSKLIEMLMLAKPKHKNVRAAQAPAAFSRFNIDKKLIVAGIPPD